MCPSNTTCHAPSPRRSTSSGIAGRCSSCAICSPWGRGSTWSLPASLKGIAPNILSERLKLLEANGLVEREFYEEHPPRALYRLTPKGEGLRTVMQALLEWGGKYLYDGVTVVHDACGHDLSLVTMCEHCGERVRGRNRKMKYRRREAAAAVGRSIG